MSAPNYSTSMWYDYPTFLHLTDCDYEFAEFMELNHDIYLEKNTSHQTAIAVSGAGREQQMYVVADTVQNKKSTRSYIRYTKMQKVILCMWYDANHRLGDRAPEIIASLIEYGKEGQYITKRNICYWFKNENERRKASARV